MTCILSAVTIPPEFTSFVNSLVAVGQETILTKEGGISVSLFEEMFSSKEKSVVMSG